MSTPKTLNGYAVLHSAPRPKSDDGALLVMVHRPGHHDPFVVATWHPSLEASWAWGHYFRDLPEAFGFFQQRAGLVPA